MAENGQNGAVIIDNDTQKIISDDSRHLRDIYDPMFAPWPPDEQPGDMGDRVRALRAKIES